MPVTYKTPLWPALKRGLKGRCPACGEGKLFRRYLKVHDRCPVCDEHLDAYPADDGPAYFTILLAGHLIVAPALFFPFFWEAPVWLAIPSALIPLVAAILLMLPLVKGAFIGALYALGVRREHQHMHTADHMD